MSQTPCPDLEVLFTQLSEGQGPAVEHSQGCPACAAVVAEHRAMEHDLFQLQDPFPPANFVPQVMAKVAAAPVSTSAELKTGLSIIGVALALAFSIAVARGATAGQFGLSVAHAAVELRAILVGLAGGLGMIWKMAAVPLSATLAALLVLSLVGLKKLTGTDVPAKV